MRLNARKKASKKWVEETENWKWSCVYCGWGKQLQQSKQDKKSDKQASKQLDIVKMMTKG